MAQLRDVPRTKAPNLGERTDIDIELDIGSGYRKRIRNTNYAPICRRICIWGSLSSHDLMPMT